MAKKKRKKNKSLPRREDYRNLTMALKDEADGEKTLRHPELIP